MRNFKKKVALLLAAMMMVSMLPFASLNVFGAVGTLISSPVPANATATANRVDSTDVNVVFRIPITEMVRLGASWAAVDIRINLSHAEPWTGDPPTGEIGQLLAVSGITGTTPGAFNYVPSVGGGSAVGGNTANQDFLFTLGDGNAATGGAINTAGYVEFSVPVTGITDARTRLNVSVSGGVDATFVAVVSGVVLVNRIALPNATQYTVARGNDVVNLHDTGISPTQLLSTVRFTEIGRIENATLQAGYTVTLRAPEGYLWTDITNVSLHAPAGSGFRVSGAGVTARAVGGGAAFGPNNDARILVITIPSGTGAGTLSRADAPLGNQRGFFDITNLKVIPETGHQFRTENLYVDVSLFQGTDNRKNASNHPARVTLHLGTQQLRGVTVTVGEAPTILAGIERGANGVNTAVITIREAGAGSLHNAPIIVSLETPGVEIVGAQWRRTTNAGAWDAYWGNPPSADGWRASDVARAEYTAIIEHGAQGSTGAREIQIRLELAVEPGLGGTDVLANVSVMALPATVSETLTIATIADPITLSAGAPAQLRMSGTELGMVFNNRLADFTISEEAARTLSQGDNLDVYLIVTANGRPVNIPVFGTATWHLDYTIDGAGLRFNTNAIERPQAALNRIPGAIAGWRFIVNRESTAAADIIFTNVFTGALLNQPGLELEVVVKGTAVQDQNNTQWNVDNGFNFVAYTVPVAYVPGEIIEPGDEPGPGPGPGPGPAEPPIVTIPASTVEVARNAVNSRGGNVFEAVNGQLWVNLRGLVESLDGGLVNWTMETGAVFTAPHATNGTITTIWQEADGFRAEVNDLVGTRGTRFVEIDSSWFVSQDAFQILFGYVPVIG